MSYDFVRESLKVFVAQTCQNIGWHAVQTSPLEYLIDVTHRYIREICKASHQYSNQYNRTAPNLDDLALSFKDLGISLQEIEEYVNNVEPVPFVHRFPPFPVKHPSNLQIPKPDSRELIIRPEHIPDYLPLMRPDLEEEEINLSDVKKNISESAGGESPSHIDSPRNGPKRDWPAEATSKKQKYGEEEGRPMREVTSIFMTSTGFLSPVHEGKSADATLPCLIDSPPPTPQAPAHSSSKKDFKIKEIKKEKSSKIKKDKESKKEAKKLKLKKAKENKENAILKHDKLSSSSSAKKEHSSHKSSKSDKSIKLDEGSKSKSKSEKQRQKMKARKEEIYKMKENFKLGKVKKLKHSMSHSSSMKSKKMKSSKMVKSPKVKHEKIKLPPPDVTPTPPTIVPPKETPPENKLSSIEVNVERHEPKNEEPMELDLFREESPEPRLVIDDSVEAQVRQERETRLAEFDECIEAVIRRGEEESEMEQVKTQKSMDETINSVARGPVIRKLEPKDIYDFTDTSDSSSLSSCDIPPHSPVRPPPPKKEKAKKSSESPKKGKSKDKSKKKVKEAKSRSPDYTPPKPQKNSNIILKVDDRTPSPIPMQDDFLSSEDSSPCPSPLPNFRDREPEPASAPTPPPFVPSTGGSSPYTSPFAPLRPLPCHIKSNPHFPTPPLFVTQSESGSTFQNAQPLNLAKPSSSALKTDNKAFESSLKTENFMEATKKAMEKGKGKDHKKEKEKVKKKSKDKKETEKIKDKKEKEEIKEKPKPKEKTKSKPEKAKVERKKSKPDKRKTKTEKPKEDSTVPKMTLKLSSGSTKIFIKPNAKNSISSSDDEDDADLPSVSSSPIRDPMPSPPREPTPTPPAPRVPTPTPPVVPEEKPEALELVKPPPAVKSHARGRGRGRKAAVQNLPPARTVITETVGTIVDESGNKIWICPACSRADDGSPMIGCDECDDWYHWVCVGIVVPPKEEENWFCSRCLAKRQGTNIKRRRKKHKKEK